MTQNNTWITYVQRLRYMFFMDVQRLENISFVFSLCFFSMVYFAKKKIPHSMITFLPFIKIEPVYSFSRYESLVSLNILALICSNHLRRMV